MNKAFSNLIKYLGKLTPTQQERVYHWLKSYVDPASTIGSQLINELRETRFKDGFKCPHCNSQHVFGLASTTIINDINAKIVPRRLTI